MVSQHQQISLQYIELLANSTQPASYYIELIQQSTSTQYILTSIDNLSIDKIDQLLTTINQKTFTTTQSKQLIISQLRSRRQLKSQLPRIQKQISQYKQETSKNSKQVIKYFLYFIGCLFAFAQKFCMYFNLRGDERIAHCHFDQSHVHKDFLMNTLYENDWQRLAQWSIYCGVEYASTWGWRWLFFNPITACLASNLSLYEFGLLLFMLKLVLQNYYQLKQLVYIRLKYEKIKNTINNHIQLLGGPLRIIPQ